MDKIQSGVRDFMEAAGQTVRTKPSFPSNEERVLRVKLLLEEVLELADASFVKVSIETDRGEAVDLRMNDINFEPLEVQNQEELFDVADAIADISYVNYGAALTYGIDMEVIEQIVQDANMAKFGEGGYRREDGKWMKPLNWEAPNDKIKDELRNQQSQ